MAMGFAAGLGAATADAAYGCVVGFGLTAISDFLKQQQFWLALFGGGFLCYLGARTFRSRPAEDAAQTRGGGWLATYGSTLILTLANPATIISFLAVFVSVGLGRRPESEGSSVNYQLASALVAGVFLGSALWWLILSGGVGLLRSQVNTGWMRAVNRLSGSVLFLFGAYALVKLVTGTAAR
jgi:threonine/homoserine/homoserine lactone efflux protein